MENRICISQHIGLNNNIQCVFDNNDVEDSSSLDSDSLNIDGSNYI